jgi:HSP20 family protein
MNMRELIPCGPNRNLPASVETQSGNPFFALHREVNRIFDDFARNFDLPAFSSGWWNGGSGGGPHVEVSETGDVAWPRREGNRGHLA